MTAPTPGPIPDTREPILDPTHAQPPAEDSYTFDHIPKLGPAKRGDKRASLLPRYGGWPGYTYAQWPVARQKEAQSRGWFPIYGAAIYTITGPEGSIDCVLLLKGLRIHGLSPDSGLRVCKIHKDIPAATGHDYVTGFPKAHSPTEETHHAASQVHVQKGQAPAHKQGKGQEDPRTRSGSGKAPDA